jgi:hypothetical protein
LKSASTRLPNHWCGQCRPSSRRFRNSKERARDSCWCSLFNALNGGDRRLLWTFC